MTEIWMIYSTFAHKGEALSVARTLLDKRLVACVNISENITSLYHWQGAVQEENEVALLAKTPQEKLSAAIEIIKALHTYELPCIVAWPLPEGFPPFLQWVSAVTGM